jgi:hypothetical protein
MLAYLLLDTLPYSSLTVRHRSLPAFLITVAPLPPGCPLNSAQGLTTCRSLHWLPLISTCVASSVRR